MAQFTPTIQQWILATEGGYVDHPSDPGGATNMGITHRTLAAWRGRSVTKQDVRNLTREEALAIYEANYWRTSGADRLPEGVDYAVFDYAVNSGPARAVKDLQRVLGVGVDGIVGAQTIAAANAAGSARTIEALSARRLAFLQGLSTFPTFGRGWTRRVSDVRVKAIALAQGSILEAGQVEAPGKANPEEPTPADSILRDPGGLSGIAGAAAAVFGAIADQPVLQVAAVVFIGLLLWRFVIARKQADPA